MKNFDLKELFNSNSSDANKKKKPPLSIVGRVRDWRIMYVVCWVLLIVSLLWGVRMMLQISNHNAIEASYSPESVHTLNRKELNKTLEQFKQEKANFTYLLNHVPETTDPSE